MADKERPILTHGDGAGPHDGARGYPGQMTWLRAACGLPPFDIVQPQVVTLATGRQIGKTKAIRFIATEKIARHDGAKRGRHVSAYMSQSHMRSGIVYHEYLSDFEKAGIVENAKDIGQARYIDFRPFGLATRGARMFFWSGENSSHPNIAGEKLHDAYIDECPLIPESAYQNTIRPMFNTTRGKAFLAGSPFPGGEGWAWFNAEFEKGVKGSYSYDPTYVSFNAPSECNPYSSIEWIKKQRAACINVSVERCQYDGLFVSDIGAVFPNLDACFSITQFRDEGNCWISEDPVDGASYTAGVDFGKYDDFTVVSIFRVDTGRQVALARLQGKLIEQFPHIDNLIRRYGNPVVFVEGRESGAMMTEFMEIRFGNLMREVKWSRGGKWDKESAIFKGIDLFQREGWALMNLKAQRDEFTVFMKEPLGPSSTGYRYRAPSGKHDDFVAAGLYAAYGLPSGLAGPKRESVKERGGILWSELHDTQAISQPRLSFSLHRRGF